MYFENKVMEIGLVVKEALVYNEGDACSLLLGVFLNPIPKVPTVDVIRKPLVDSGKVIGNLPLTKIDDSTYHRYGGKVKEEIVTGKGIQVAATYFNECITEYYTSVFNSYINRVGIVYYKANGTVEHTNFKIDILNKHEKQFIKDFDCKEHQEDYMDDVYDDIKHGYVNSLLGYLIIDDNGFTRPDVVEQLIHYVEKLQNK